MSFGQIPFVIGAFAILGGLYNILARDRVWSWVKMMDGFWGKRVERTDLWDFWQVLRGLGLIVFGLYMISMGLSVNG